MPSDLVSDKIGRQFRYFRYLADKFAQQAERFVLFLVGTFLL